MEGKFRWSQGGGLWEGDGGGGWRGRINEESLPLTLCTYVRIPMPTSIACMGKWGNGKAARGKLTKCCVQVCHYHYEHDDVKLQCNNKCIKMQKIKMLKPWQYQQWSSHSRWDCVKTPRKAQDWLKGSARPGLYEREKDALTSYSISLAKLRTGNQRPGSCS